MTRLDASDLANRLGREAEAVCRHYLDAGHRQGNYWQVGDVRNTPGRSMFVRLKATVKGPAGKWTDAATGDPLPNICGVLQSAVASSFYYSSGTCTDAQGQYTSQDLPGGSYTFTMSDDHGPYLSQTYPTPIDVTLAETTPGIDFALDKGGSFSGTLRDDVTNAPLSKICVVAYPVGGGAASQQRCSDTSGHYATAGLPDGSYDLEFTNPTGRYITEWYDDASSQASATALPVAPGEDTAGIDATLKLGGVVAGTVTSASTGEPLAGVCVNLYDASDDSFGGATICTGADGKYESAAIPAGQYKVGFVDGSGAYAPQYYSNKETLADADPVTVTSGGKDRPLLDCTDVAVPSDDLALDTTSVVGFDTATPDDLDAIGLAGRTGIAYESNDHLYLATQSGWGENCTRCFLDTGSPIARGPLTGSSYLFDFALDGTAATHVALRVVGWTLPLLMAFAVVATANHYIVDVVVGIAFALVGYGAALLLERRRLARAAP